MRLHAARDLDASAWHGGDPRAEGRVQFRVGVTRYSATPEEAMDLARQLIEAVEEVRGMEAEARGG